MNNDMNIILNQMIKSAKVSEVVRIHLQVIISETKCEAFRFVEYMKREVYSENGTPPQMTE
jgi:hypothetical protein